MTNATATYNFVGLPEKILPAQFDGVEGFKEHIGAAENLSGEISLDIEALTPLFIGGLGSKSFAPADMPIIPGSTLRGMFKNLFKVVTCGTFLGQEDFNDEHIYFRCLMGVRRYPWTKDLNKLYNGRMIHSAKGKDGKLRPVKSARPGFLICTNDNKFFIAPSIYNSDRKEDRILIREYEKKFNVKIPERNSSCVKWHGTAAYIITGSQANWKLLDEKAYANLKTDDEKKKAGKQFIRYTRLDYVDWSRDHWIALPDEVLSSYRHDRNRSGVNLLEDKWSFKGKLPPDVKTLTPCHFLEEKEQITAFGHGQCFRIPYQKRIGDAVPKNLQSDKIDFADALFGGKNWASRVYFEDAVPVNFSELREAMVHPLMQPNPTSYQLYLKQDSDKLKHWDTVDAKLRGYKFYWHNDTPDWHANESERKLNDERIKKKQEPLTKVITPLDKGSHFTAKIRFKNLSAVELGAFMMIFDLDGAKNPAYKIGMGKPFGFGSIKITPTLFIECENAYTELFDANGWKDPCREKNPAEYLHAFKNYVVDKNMLATWQNVMRELNAILDWSLTTRKNWNTKIKSMSGDVSQADGVDERFKQRESLPTIFEVVK